MSPSGRSERLYLSDARDAIDRVLSYTAGGRGRFFDEAMVQDAVVAELRFPSKSEQPARDEVAGGLLGAGVTGQAEGWGSGCSFLRERRSLAWASASRAR